MNDLISRQAAIDALGKDPGFKVKLFGKSYDEGRSDQWFKDVHVLTALPTVQPEIIRCKDCKYMIDIGDDLMCDNAKGWVVATTSDFGCVLAERRTE